jgi:hypothetical protein
LGSLFLHAPKIKPIKSATINKAYLYRVFILTSPLFEINQPHRQGAKNAKNIRKLGALRLGGEKELLVRPSTFNRGTTQTCNTQSHSASLRGL